MNTYRIRKGVKGYTGHRFTTRDSKETHEILVGTVHTTYKSYTNRAYRRNELEETA